jgi:hypothetical protein
MVMTTAHWLGHTLIVMALLGTAGCRRRPSDITPVHGKVSYRGEAVPCGTIVFTPDASRGHEGALARGEIKPDGSFSLRTDQGYGAVPGWYRVTIMAVEAPGRPADGQPYAMPRSLIPERYRDPELAGLLREVKAGQANLINFDLE